jgi:hypothetical protein
MRYCIVGGGTAGLVSALILKTRFPNSEVDLIKSEKIGIIGVGEGSTEHWQDFADYVGISNDELIKETDATFKIGIMFKDWGVPDYMHSIQDGYNLLLQNQYPYIYANIIKDNVHSDNLSNKGFWQNKINTWYFENNQSPVAQYHFNTFKLNKFLTDKVLAKGVNIFDDEILEVNHDSEGNISTLVSKDYTYEYDFYIDSTGFRKLLISSMGAKWISHKDYLATNSAIVFQTPDTENYNMWSLAQGMKYGWMFRTPTYGRWGNGYIFDDEFITPEQAKAEVEEVLGHEITIGKHIKFDPGALDKTWIKNCCAVGLSSSFIEPLEASSIGATIQQVFMLINSLAGYNQTTIDHYNSSYRSVVENIRDFIVIHFLCKRNDTEFWKKVSNLPIPDSLQEKLDLWRDRIPCEMDFDKDSKYIMFKSLHFLMVAHGLELFNTEGIKQEFESLSRDIRFDADNVVKDLKNENDVNEEFVTHKEFLTMVRNL